MTAGCRQSTESSCRTRLSRPADLDLACGRGRGREEERWEWERDDVTYNHV